MAEYIFKNVKNRLVAEGHDVLQQDIFTRPLTVDIAGLEVEAAACKLKKSVAVYIAGRATAYRASVWIGGVAE